VILPALNESANLGELLPVLAHTLAPLATTLELIVVDDGSTDDTALMLAGLHAQGLPVRLLKLSRNFGKEAALTAGLDHARGDVVVTMDSDGQHPVALVPAMLERWQAGVDVVYGVQTDRRATQPWLRRLFTRLFYRVIGSGSRVDIPSDAGDFRLLDRRVVNALRSLPERSRYMKGLFAWVGFRSEAIEFAAQERLHGESHFRFGPLFGLAITGITAFTQLPLRLVSVAGMLISLIALLYGGYIVAETLIVGNAVSGWATLAASIMLLSGIQLICLGIIGEYLGRIFDEVKQRPLYLIDSDWPPASHPLDRQ
jgi:glycosyltransferase involved in cell wall biosynthesis